MDECCPEFDPEKWDKKRFNWEYKKFIEAKVRCFLYMPLNFGSVMKKLDRITNKHGINIEDNLCLSYHRSKSEMEVLLAVDYPCPEVINVVRSGEFISRVYEGPYKNTGAWSKDFDSYCMKEAVQIKKIYMWYVYCPRCSKKYGKNYTVIIGQIK